MSHKRKTSSDAGLTLTGTGHDKAAKSSLRHTKNVPSLDYIQEFISVLTDLNSAVTSDQVADVIMQSITSVFQARVGVIGLISDNGEILKCDRIVGVTTETADQWREFPITSSVPITDSIRERRTIVMLTAEDYALAYPERAKDRSRALDGAVIGAPMFVNDRCIGGIGMICPPDKCSSSQQQAFLETLAKQYALALDRARTYDIAKAKHETSTREIAENGRKMDTLWKNDLRYHALADNIAQIAWMADASGEIYWWNKRWYEFSGLSPTEMYDIDWTRIHHPEHYARIRTNYFEHIQEGREWTDTLPMRRKDGVFRWFLSHSFPVRNDSGEVVAWFGTNTDITEQYVAAERVSKAFEHEALLNQIGQAVRSTTDPEKIQSAAVEAVGSFLKADRVFFSSINTTRKLFWIGKDYCGRDLPSLAGRYRLSEFVSDPTDLKNEGKTWVLSGISKSNLDIETKQWFQGARIESIIQVPLIEDGKLVGALVVAMAYDIRVWTAEEIKLVESVALLVRSALDVARVQEYEHRIAIELQFALQPILPSEITGMEIGTYTEPALDEAAIGGDFFDVFQLDKNRYALVIGDVSGKGLRAAQQLALVRNSLRTTLYLFDDPRKAVEALNKIITSHRLLEGFVTAFIGIYYADTGSIKYFSCGHEPGLIRRSTTGSVEELMLSGPPIGVAHDTEYPVEIINLNEGDTLVLYTDGISESLSTDNEMLGAMGVSVLVKSCPSNLDVTERAEHLVTRARIRANGVFRDDVAVLIAKRV